MKNKSHKQKPKQGGLQYGLPVLFGLMTFFCFAFAYPRFVLGWAGLLFGSLGVLVAFLVLVFFPVSLIASWIHSKAGKPEPDFAKRDGRTKL